MNINVVTILIVIVLLVALLLAVLLGTPEEQNAILQAIATILGL
ncbi:hypothetical protein V7056_18780 [Bacillus sp. JJ664]